MVNDRYFGLGPEGETCKGEPDVHGDIFVIEHERILVVTARPHVSLAAIQAAEGIDLFADRVGAGVAAEVICRKKTIRNEFSGFVVTFLIRKQNDVAPG